MSCTLDVLPVWVSLRLHGRELLAVGNANDFLIDQTVWGNNKADRFKRQAASSLSVQKGHFLPWLPLLTPLLAWKEWLQISIIKASPSLGFIGWLRLTCRAWLFTERLWSSSSFLWTAGPWRLGGGVSLFWEVSSPLVVSGSTEMLQILC